MSLGRTSPARTFRLWQGAGKAPQPEPGADQVPRCPFWLPAHLQSPANGWRESPHPAPLPGLSYAAEMMKLIKSEQTDAGWRGTLTGVGWGGEGWRKGMVGCRCSCQLHMKGGSLAADNQIPIRRFSEVNKVVKAPTWSV